MKGTKEIQILSRILRLMKTQGYEDDDDFAIQLSRFFLIHSGRHQFLASAKSIRTSFFRKNGARRRPFTELVYNDLSKMKLSDTTSFPKQISLDDIDSFRRIKGYTSRVKHLDILEEQVKGAVIRIIGEPYKHKDSPAERSDIFSTRIKLNGKRVSAVIALNGRGKFKTKKTEMVYTIADSGKNGDQIVKLFEEAATLFILQCVGRFDNRVYTEMQTHAYKKSNGGQDEVYYCLVDGNDTDRILKAAACSKASTNKVNHKILVTKRSPAYFGFFGFAERCTKIQPLQVFGGN